jgi:DNA-binding GntR family transcriptional regulator
MGTRNARMTSEPAKPARPTGADEAIYQKMAQAIVDHSLPPGTKLTEDVLAEIFGVSRTVVRSALLRLAYEGLVDLQPNRGAFVAQPSIQEARDVFAARRTVECGIVGEAAGRIAKNGARDLLHSVEAERAAHERGDRAALITLSGDFHLKLAEISGNQVLADILRQLVSRSSLAIAVYQAPGRPACRCDDHRRIVDALRAGDAAAAARLMEAHLRDVENALNLDEEPAGAIDLRAVFAGTRRRSALASDRDQEPATASGGAIAAVQRRK